MLKVDCRRCGKELDVPGALVFGDHLLAWIYRDADVVFHGRGLVREGPSRVCGKAYQGGACRLPLGHAGHCQD